jgi:hypothetical protein
MFSLMERAFWPNRKMAQPLDGYLLVDGTKNAQSSRLQGVKLHNGQPLDLTSDMGSFPRPPQTILQQEDGKSNR